MKPTFKAKEIEESPTITEDEEFTTSEEDLKEHKKEKEQEEEELIEFRDFSSQTNFESEKDVEIKSNIVKKSNEVRSSKKVENTFQSQINSNVEQIKIQQLLMDELAPFLQNSVDLEFILKMLKITKHSLGDPNFQQELLQLNYQQVKNISSNTISTMKSSVSFNFLICGSIYILYFQLI